MSAENPVETLPEAEFEEMMTRFIVSWPLYRKYEFAGNFRIRTEIQRPIHALDFPSVILMECSQCQHSQPWNVVLPHEGQIVLQGQAEAFVRVEYQCRACDASKNYWLLMAFHEAGGSMIKVGQYPPLELEPPKLVASVMEKRDLALYRRALTTRNSNFGIAAVAYLRRIV